MKTSTNTTVTNTFTSSDTAVECTFDPDGAAHLMSVLSNMYRDKSMAVLREYSANARDAHIKAENAAPIKVTLPTAWNPQLVVTDQGVGLSRDEIVSVYSRYGLSTKRGGNDQVGAFGIGAKSAFTISTQFTVTGTKDGTKTTALFSLNDDGIGTVEIVAQTPTEDPNGVTVSVAVDDPAAMRQAATTLFGCWEPGTVVVDGETPAYLPNSMLAINDTLYARHRKASDADDRTGVTIVMGGIPYPASEPMLRAAKKLCQDDAVALATIDKMVDSRYHDSLHLLAIVPVGDVDITPSREDLRDTPRTIAMLARIFTDFVHHRATAVRRAIDAEATEMHASARLVDLGRFLLDMYTQGTFWRDQWLAPELQLPFASITLDTHGRRNRTKFVDTTAIRLGTSFEDTIVVTDVDDDALKTVRRLANRFMTHSNIDTMILAPHGRGRAGWFVYGGQSPITTMTFADFKTKAAALPKVSEAREPSYDVYTSSGRRNMTCTQITDAIAAGRRLLYVSQLYSAAESQLATDALGPDDMLITLCGAQTEKALFKRFPSVRPASPIIRDHALRVIATMTTQERLALEYKDTHTERITEIPELRALGPVRAYLDRVNARRNAFRALNTGRHEYLKRALVEFNRCTGEPFTADHSTGYPLLDVVLHNVCSNTFGFPAYDDDIHEHLTRYLASVDAQTSAPVA